MLLLPPRNPDRKNWPGGGGRAAEEAEVKNKKEGTRAREGRDELGLVKYGSANKREASGRAERDAQADDIPNLLHSSLSLCCRVSIFIFEGRKSLTFSRCLNHRCAGESFEYLGRFTFQVNAERERRRRKREVVVVKERVARRDNRVSFYIAVSRASLFPLLLSTFFFLSLFPFSGSPSSPLASFLYNSTQDDGDATKRTFTSIKPSFGRHFPSLLFIIALLFPAVCLWALAVRYGLFAYANLPGPISVQRERGSQSGAIILFSQDQSRIHLGHDVLLGKKKKI